jgi:hypothetical protein
VLRDVRGLESAKSMPGVVELSFSGEIGRRYFPLNSNLDRIGYLIAVGDTVEDSARRAEQAMRAVTLDWTASPLGPGGDGPGGDGPGGDGPAKSAAPGE